MNVWTTNEGGQFKVLMNSTGSLMLSNTCCCSTTTTTTTTTTAGGFPGTGYYCILPYQGPSCDPGDLVCTGFPICVNITDEATWNSYDFGACNYDDYVGEYVMYVAGFGPGTNAECLAACQCPT